MLTTVILGKSQRNNNAYDSTPSFLQLPVPLALLCRRSSGVGPRSERNVIVLEEFAAIVKLTFVAALAGRLGDSAGSG
jgi:hypothetical protein